MQGTKDSKAEPGARLIPYSEIRPEQTEPLLGGRAYHPGETEAQRQRLDGCKLVSQRKEWQASLLLIFDSCVTPAGASTDTRREQKVMATNGPAASTPLGSPTSSGCY